MRRVLVRYLVAEAIKALSYVLYRASVFVAPSQSITLMSADTLPPGAILRNSKGNFMLEEDGSWTKLDEDELPDIDPEAWKAFEQSLHEEPGTGE
jgi:hypothetical protein